MPVTSELRAGRALSYGMQKRYMTFIVLGFAVIAFVTVRIARKQNGPMFQRCRLSYWVALYPTAGSMQEASANEAVTHSETNGIPFLLKWIRYERPAWRTRLAVAARRWPMPLQRLA